MTKLELIKNAKPILFNTDMVRDILAGYKTVTRRVIKPSPTRKFAGWVIDGGKNQIGCAVFSNDEYNHTGAEYRKPKYEIGDLLYARETFKQYEKAVGYEETWHLAKFWAYKADETNDNVQKPCEWYDGEWKPSIHMPKEAARLFLRVTDVRVERLQNISEENALDEGIKEYTKDNTVFKYCVDIECEKWSNLPRTAKEAFAIYWNSLLGKKDLKIYGWDANPWVWVIKFERVNVDGKD